MKHNISYGQYYHFDGDPENLFYSVAGIQYAKKHFLGMKEVSHIVLTKCDPLELHPTYTWKTEYNIDDFIFFLNKKIWKPYDIISGKYK